MTLYELCLRHLLQALGLNHTQIITLGDKLHLAVPDRGVPLGAAAGYVAERLADPLSGALFECNAMTHFIMQPAREETRSQARVDFAKAMKRWRQWYTQLLAYDKDQPLPARLTLPLRRFLLWPDFPQPATSDIYCLIAIWRFQTLEGTPYRSRHDLAATSTLLPLPLRFDGTYQRVVIAPSPVGHPATTQAGTFRRLLHSAGETSE